MILIYSEYLKHLLLYGKECKDPQNTWSDIIFIGEEKKITRTKIS